MTQLQLSNYFQLEVIKQQRLRSPYWLGSVFQYISPTTGAAGAIKGAGWR
ncbi:MAG: hypothetical protein GPOALKHO_001954 [Sodalis sp.]|nr:MAG: hypothetical protein GPOALKHO_001954 [Sodalis sp.]